MRRALQPCNIDDNVMTTVVTIINSLIDTTVIIE